MRVLKKYMEFLSGDSGIYFTEKEVMCVSDLDLIKHSPHGKVFKKKGKQTE